MGVLRLFRHFINAYKGFYTSHARLPGKSQWFDYVLIDLNAIFHPACREVYSPEFKSLLHRPPQVPPDILEERAFKRITEMIENIIRVCRPRQTLYLAIDGVAGMCKQSQQRKRRFRAAQLRDKDATFDTANITAGTPWMARLCKYIAEWVKQKKQTKLLERVAVVYSDMFVPGEGEHKLMRYLGNVKQPQFTYCVYSPDADLIMLCMCLPKGRGFILRENIYDDVEGHWLLVDCGNLKDQVYDTIAWGENIDVKMMHVHHQRVIKDFVLFLMLIGNDFLPSLYCLEILNEGMNVLAQSYVEAASKHGYLVSEVNDINLKTFTHLFECLASHEPALMLRKYKRGNKYPDNMLARNITREPNRQGVYEERVDYDNLRKEYYMNKFPEFTDWDTQFDKNVHEICSAYVHGLSFVIKYYSVSIPTFEWYFEYHYAPLMTDLHRFAKDSKISVWNDLQSWTFQPALTLNQALLGIIPPSSVNVLPTSLQPLLQRNAEHELFKEDFKVDLEGKQQDYEAVLLLPIVDYKTLKMMCKDTSSPGTVLTY